MSEYSHALLPLSSKTKPLAPVSTAQAQCEHRKQPCFLFLWTTDSRSEEQSSKLPCRAPAVAVCFKEGDLDGFGRLFHFRWDTVQQKGFL